MLREDNQLRELIAPICEELPTMNQARKIGYGAYRPTRDVLFDWEGRGGFE
jgi:hypothetical protein